MGIQTTVLLMITRKLLHSYLVLLVGFALLSHNVLVQAQEESGDDSGDNSDSDEEFMTSDGKEDFMEYRLHDESEKGLNDDYYIDYQPEDDGGISRSEESDDGETEYEVFDMLEEYALEEKAFDEGDEIYD